MITPLYDNGGRYRGFVAGNTVYDRRGCPLGLVEGCNVFNSCGELIGELRGQSIVAPETASKPRRAWPAGGRIRAWLTNRFERFRSSTEPFDRLDRA
jgi:hypothetical protein